MSAWILIIVQQIAKPSKHPHSLHFVNRRGENFLPRVSKIGSLARSKFLSFCVGWARRFSLRNQTYTCASARFLARQGLAKNQHMHTPICSLRMTWSFMASLLAKRFSQLNPFLTNFFPQHGSNYDLITWTIYLQSLLLWRFKFTTRYVEVLPFTIYTTSSWTGTPYKSKWCVLCVFTWRVSSHLNFSPIYKSEVLHIYTRLWVCLNAKWS